MEHFPRCTARWVVVAVTASALGVPARAAVLEISVTGAVKEWTTPDGEPLRPANDEPIRLTFRIDPSFAPEGRYTGPGRASYLAFGEQAVRFLSASFTVDGRTYSSFSDATNIVGHVLLIDGELLPPGDELHLSEQTASENFQDFSQYRKFSLSLAVLAPSGLVEGDQLDQASRTVLLGPQTIGSSFGWRAGYEEALGGRFDALSITYRLPEPRPLPMLAVVVAALLGGCSRHRARGDFERVDTPSDGAVDLAPRSQHFVVGTEPVQAAGKS